MAGQQENYPTLPITAIVSLTLALMAWWLVREPLVSTRHEAERPAEKHEQLVQARLWQDPVEAVRTREDGESVSRFGFNGRPSARNIAVLVVMTEGGPYVENHEKRLRDRYAVVSALAAACFAPSDAEHIGSKILENPKKPVAFEWYEASPLKKCHSDQTYSQHYDHVLVVWTTDSMLGGEPIVTLRKLIGSLLGEYWTDRCLTQHSLHCFSQLVIKLIGPPDSPTLRMMLEWAGKGQVILSETYWPGLPYRTPSVELYSPWATADPKLLLQEVAGCDAQRSRELAIKKCLEKAGIALEYTVTSDGGLTRALAHELRRRQVALEKDRIVLISEWDTFYGRALPIAFETSVDDLIEEKTEKNPDIRRYSYLRGLDGLTPKDSKRSDQRDAGKVKNGSLQEATARAQLLQELERPDGESQLDYLRRLAAKIRQDATRDGKPVKAIGVLGSDIYDTKLILKALRDEFSGVWFFTTTLDARLFEESDYPWTRNLIIASPFGLELHQKLQGEIPPFRDSYQTSAFFSVLRAVGQIQGPSLPVGGNVGCKETTGKSEFLPSSSYFVDGRVNGKIFSAHLCARLFEIGRYDPVDLSADRASLELKENVLPLQPARELLPQGMKPWWPGSTATERIGVTRTVVSLGLALVIFLLVFTRSFGRGTNHLEGLSTEFKMSATQIRFRVGTGILSALVILSAVLLYARHKTLEEGWEGEPISLMDGVSIWPSVVIRLMVICWCICCGLLGWICLRLNQARLRETYELTEPQIVPVTFLEHLQELISSIRWILAVPKSDVAGSDNKVSYKDQINKIYHEYQSAGALWYRLLRAAILTVVYWLLVLIVLAALAGGPLFEPCRGDFNCSFSVTVRFCAVLAMLVLNMFVFDAVLLCQGFVLRMKGVTAKAWPAPSDQQQELEQDNKKTLYVSSAHTVHLVADHTAVLNRIVFYPFIALFLMIVSRNRYFDGWDFPTGLIVIWMLYAFIALTSIARLRTAAWKVRDSVLESLRKQVFEAEYKNEGKDQAMERLRRLMEELRDVRKGAYAPLLRHPAFGTALIAMVALLQYWVFGR